MPKSFAATWVFYSAISRDLEAKIPFILCRQLVKVLSHVFFYILHFILLVSFSFSEHPTYTIIHFDCSDLQMAFGCWQRIQGHQTQVHIICVASIESLAIKINTPAYQLFGMVNRPPIFLALYSLESTMLGVINASEKLSIPGLLTYLLRQTQGCNSSKSVSIHQK